MRRRTALALTAAVVVPVGLPAVAGARLPTPASKRIVLGASIGGVRPGMTLAAAERAWGPGGISEADDACQVSGRTSCIWTGTSSRERGLITLAADGTVDSVRIVGGPSSRLATWKTSKGFGIGTTTSTLMRAYPGPLPAPAGLGAPPGTGSVLLVRRTSFFISRSTGRVLGVGV